MSVLHVKRLSESTNVDALSKAVGIMGTLFCSAWEHCSSMGMKSLVSPLHKKKIVVRAPLLCTVDIMPQIGTKISCSILRERSLA